MIWRDDDDSQISILELRLLYYPILSNALMIRESYSRLDHRDIPEMYLERIEGCEDISATSQA
jgi:hypothetical protein